VLISGEVKELEDREGYKAILVDDCSQYTVIRDYKEGGNDLKIGDFIRAYGSVRKNSKQL